MSLLWHPICLICYFSLLWGLIEFLANLHGNFHSKVVLTIRGKVLIELLTFLKGKAIRIWAHNVYHALTTSFTCDSIRTCNSIPTRGEIDRWRNKKFVITNIERNRWGKDLNSRSFAHWSPNIMLSYQFF